MEMRAKNIVVLSKAFLSAPWVKEWDTFLGPRVREESSRNPEASPN